MANLYVTYERIAVIPKSMSSKQLKIVRISRNLRCRTSNTFARYSGAIARNLCDSWAFLSVLATRGRLSWLLVSF